MNAVVQIKGARPGNGQPHESPDATGRQDSLQRAVLTLRAIRQRYESGRDAHSFVRFCTVQVAVDSGDMAWITAAIEALEETVVAGATEVAGSAFQAHLET